VGGRGDASRAVKLAFLIVERSTSLVPKARRADWEREWKAELWARTVEGRPVLVSALGAVTHGVFLRRDAWMRWVVRVGRDMRYGARSLRRRPLFSVSAVLTLALGLGATTAVYSVVDAVLLAPLPYPGAERFVRIEARHVGWDMTMPLSVELFTEWRRVSGFEAVEMYTTRDAHLVGAGTPVIVREARVSAGFLSDLLSVRPRLGRLFDAAESGGRGPRVAVISERFWMERFAGSADVLGESVRINDAQHEVVGVVPAVHLLPAVDVWTLHPLEVDHSRTLLGALRAIGRIDAGLTRSDALARLEAAHNEAARDYPASMAPFAPVITDYRSSLVADVRTHLLLLLGAVAVVLVIACVNVTNLLLARGAERGHELAIRTSLGAGRSHLISQLLAEGIVLALAGGAAGLVLAAVSVNGMLALLPAEIPLASSVRLDGRVVAFAATATLGTAILVGLLPVLRAGPETATASGGRRGTLTRGQRRAGRLLLGLEVAQAGALLVIAGLMINTLVRMSSARPGFDTRGLLFVHLDLPPYTFATAENPTGRAEFMEALRARLRELPGVRSVAIGSATPFSGMTFMTGVEPEGGVNPRAGDGGLRVMETGGNRLLHFSRLHVDPSYLETLALPVVVGRGLTPSDLDATETVALINETAALAYWPGEHPVGRRLREGDGPWMTIVGVVGDFGHPGLPTRGIAELYVPMSRAVLPSISRPTALIRHDGPAPELMERVRREIWALDPELPIPAVATAIDEMGSSLATPRFYAILLGAFAALALVLASVGIYGVVAHSVARRTREIGIRMALGAQAGEVGAMVMREGMQVIGVGLVAGLATGAAASRLLEGLLYGVKPTDPWTFAGVAALLAAVAAVAVWVPARRAMKADPLASLRTE
jgi:putative ABC transport system permease protein